MRHLTHTTPAGALHIDDAIVDDAAVVTALHRSVLEEGRYFITAADEFSGSAEHKAALIRSMSRQEHCCFLVARLDEVVVGMISLRGGPLRRMRHVAKLEIFVVSQARGQGVGRALMDTALGWAADNPILQKIGLSVFDDNIRAIALYEKLGFSEEGRRSGEYREADGTLRGDVLMYRWL
ncbi:MAG: ribosomal protein S18 acetylase RimI-like enzyme [Myxococcota bacterium]|jgi:ribosomal protein S18 acetylase RimI-like enzyme